MDNIRQNVDALSKKMLEHPKANSKRLPSLLPSTVSLLVVSKVVPTRKLIRLMLPHGIEEPAVCLIVKDTDKRDYNRSVEAWKLRWKSDKAKASEISSVQTPTFLPLRELKLAYQTFTARRRLAATFDVFLADRRIVHHLPTKLGKPFYGEARGKLPVPVDLHKGNLVQTVSTQAKTVLFSIRGIGTSESIPIGTMQMTLAEIKDNILYVCEKLCGEWPGEGLKNIRSIYVQVPEGNIPIYFDPSEPSLQLLIAAPNQGTESRATELKATTRILAMDLINKVAEDLPLPQGGLEEVFAARKKRIQPKRVSTQKVLRKGSNGRAVKKQS